MIHRKTTPEKAKKSAVANGEHSSFWSEHKKDRKTTPSINILSFFLNLYTLPRYHSIPLPFWPH